MAKIAQNIVTLRDVVADDLPIFYTHMQDADALFMASFTPKDPSDRHGFNAHWVRIMGDDTVTTKTIIVGNQVVGHVLSYEEEGQIEISYWIDKAYWGKGITTIALSQFLTHQTARPLYARAVKDNIGSVRVLEKCGFKIIGEDKGFANARGKEVEEFILELSTK